MKVKFDETLESQDAWGKCEFKNNQILLYPYLDPPVVEQVFWHEVVHLLLTRLGYDDLSKDERLVDGLGGGLQQIIKTRRGELEYSTRKKKKDKKQKAVNGVQKSVREENK